MELGFRAWGGLLLLVLAAVGQEASGTAGVLENAGKPMRVPYRCTNEDIRWAGMSCSDQEPCPVYLELTGVESAGNRLFAPGDIHTQTVTLYAVLLASEDAGSTWREVLPRIRGAGLDRIQFADLLNGWVTGEALSPLPQDPFLLITSDGGKSWRQHPLFAESRVGSIQEFGFNSKRDGGLVFDRGKGGGSERYERYQSTDAGETWALKEASREPIRLKDPAGLPPSWRVQADGPTQAFRIERQQAGRWAPVASFAVNLGICTPPDSDPAPAPPAKKEAAAK